jgi:hypothetical protein
MESILGRVEEGRTLGGFGGSCQTGASSGRFEDVERLSRKNAASMILFFQSDLGNIRYTAIAAADLVSVHQTLRNRRSIMSAVSQLPALNTARADSAPARHCRPELVGGDTALRSRRRDRRFLPSGHKPFLYKGNMAPNGGFRQMGIQYG